MPTRTTDSRRPSSLVAAALAAALVLIPSPGASAATSQVVIETASTTTGFGIAPGGRVFYGGIGDGSIRVWTPRTGDTTVFATVPGAVRLHGLVLDPDFATRPYVYAFASVRTATRGLRMHLVRYTASGSTGSGFRLLRDVAAEGTDHSGGGMAFTRDDLLLLAVGDGGTPALAQDAASSHGKVLRLTRTGAVAPGNPGGRPWIASGIRNSVGLAVDPETGRLWATENGPECNDELNWIRAGSNYGWGASGTCEPGTIRGTNQDGAAPRLPAAWSSAPTAPTGAVFCSGCGLDDAEGGLVYGRFVSEDLRLVTLGGARAGVAAERTIYQHTGPVIGVQRHPSSGRIWFSDGTSIRRLVP